MKDKHYFGIQFFADPAPTDPPEPDPAPTDPPADNSAELAKLKEELSKAKAAVTKATKEAAEYKRIARANQTAEEQRAAEEKERQEALEAELAEFRKKAAVAETAKRVLSFITDETAATSIAESLYGAEDVDAAIDAINKAWATREKKLRMEFGKIPAPGAGGDEPTITKEQFSNMTYKERMEIFKNHPSLYEKLTN